MTRRGWHRTNDGYVSNTPPWQYHPMTVNDEGEIDGDNPWEDFADMFVNWVFNTFASNDAGSARYDWMQEHANTWIK
jgi:hypothetical protein